MIEGLRRANGSDHADVQFFRTSSHSGGGNCVEVGVRPDGGVVVRDTKDPVRATALAFDRAEWHAFLKGAKAGEFDT